MSITPQNVLDQFNRQDHWEGITTTLQGIKFNVFDPKLEDIDSRDMIYGMANSYRFAGLSYPLVTVAEHVIMVSEIIDRLWGPKFEKHGLIHDAQEAYLHDLPATYRHRVTVFNPITKKQMAWMRFEDTLARPIHEKLGLVFPEKGTQGQLQVRAADLLAARIEKDSIDTLGDDDWGLPPLPDEIRNFQYEFWDNERAAEELTKRWIEMGLWYLETVKD